MPYLGFRKTVTLSFMDNLTWVNSPLIWNVIELTVSASIWRLRENYQSVLIRRAYSNLHDDGSLSLVHVMYKTVSMLGASS